MPKGHIWPLLASKRQKKGFLGPQNKVFCILWHPDAKNDPPPENIKRPDFKKKKIVSNAKRSFSASEGHKWQIKLFSSPNKGFSGSRNKVFRVLWPPEAKNDPHSENTKKFNFEKNFLVFYAKRLYLASGGRKTAKERIFGSTE